MATLSVSYLVFCLLSLGSAEGDVSHLARWYAGALTQLFLSFFRVMFVTFMFTAVLQMSGLSGTGIYRDMNIFHMTQYNYLCSLCLICRNTEKGVMCYSLQIWHILSQECLEPFWECTTFFCFSKGHGPPSPSLTRDDKAHTLSL